MSTIQHTSGAGARPIVAVLLFATAACAPAATMNGGSVSGGPTDAEIASIALALNQGEVVTNRPAVEQAAQAEVRQFAQRMVTDHTAAVEQMRALDLGAGEHPLSRQLAQSAQETVSVLAQYEGAAFDRAHMDSQVELHEYALNSLETFLIPSARNAQLRALLEANRGVVQTHLEQARRVRGSLADR